MWDRKFSLHTKFHADVQMGEKAVISDELHLKW